MVAAAPQIEMLRRPREPNSVPPLLFKVKRGSRPVCVVQRTCNTGGFPQDVESLGDRLQVVVEEITPSDFNPDQARASRSDLVERPGYTDTLVIGTHFADPVAGHIRRDGASFRLISDDESYRVTRHADRA
jgi:hypothetical protein